MGIALGTALVLVVLGVLAYPFLRRDRYAPAADPAPARLRAARLRVYRLIADLEADRESGELTDDDYRAQLKPLRIRAAQLLREEERFGAPASEEELLEQEILAARRGRSAPPEGGDAL